MKKSPETRPDSLVPPKLAVRFLEFVLPRERSPSMIGDLCEEYYEIGINSSRSFTAKIWFWQQTVLLFLTWGFKGNLVLLAGVLDSLFFVTLGITAVRMSSTEATLGQSLTSPVVIYPILACFFLIIRNSNELKDSVAYLKDGASVLSSSNLLKLHQLVQSMKYLCFPAYVILVAVLAAVVQTSESLSPFQPQPFYLVGLAWLLVMHAVALWSLLSLWEDRLCADVYQTRSRQGQ